MDWKEALGKFRDSADLPAGEEDANPATESDKTANVQKDALRVVVDRKGRKGKTATIVEGFTLNEDRVAEIAAMLKRRLGVGGSARDGEILIQGDFAAKVKDLLIAEGFKVK